MTKWNKLATKESVDKTIQSLKTNGMDAFYLKTAEEAKKKIFEILPKNSEVFAMSSVTLDTLGISKEINESKEYNSVRTKLMSLNRETQGKEMRKLGAGPDWTIGSIHALTEDGKALIASNTGSQLPAYAYGAGNLIWVVGSQKIVKDLDKGMKRIYEYVLPLESERAKKAYGVPGSAVNKILIVNKEVQQGRIIILIVNEVLGF
jgi:hypothetical protein